MRNLFLTTKKFLALALLFSLFLPFLAFAQESSASTESSFVESEKDPCNLPVFDCSSKTLCRDCGSLSYDGCPNAPEPGWLDCVSKIISAHQTCMNECISKTTFCNYEYVSKLTKCANSQVTQPSSIPLPSSDAWVPPTPAEQAIEEPLISPADILSLGGFLGRAIGKGLSLVSTKAAGRLTDWLAKKTAKDELITVYHYFKDDVQSSIAKSIVENGIKTSSGLGSTLGYENRVFVSLIPPEKISRLNLFSYGIKNADSFVGLVVKKSDLGIPAQTFYYGEKGARFISRNSNLYRIASNGLNYIQPGSITSIGNFGAPQLKNIGNVWNNILDIPRSLTRYWVMGGAVGFDIAAFSGAFKKAPSK